MLRMAIMMAMRPHTFDHQPLVAAARTEVAAAAMLTTWPQAGADESCRRASPSSSRSQLLCRRPPACTQSLDPGQAELALQGMFTL
jgi:hypothetical protein